MNRFLVALTRISILLLLIFAGHSFQLNTGKAAASSSPSAASVALDLQQSTIYLPVVTGRNYVEPKPLWRFGVAKARNPLETYFPHDLVSMRFGWYVDFTYTNYLQQPYGMEYVPTVRLKQLKDDNGTPVSCCATCGYVAPYETPAFGVNYYAYPTLSQIPALVASHPGLTWLIGNEMDRVDSTSPTSGRCNSQDEMLPEFYAQVYHDYYYAIKTADPTAKVAIGAMTQFTPLRQEYLQKVWDAYQAKYSPEAMPVDIWNIHLYILREKDCQVDPVDCWGAEVPPGSTAATGMLYNILDIKNFDLAWDQIKNLRQWMKDHGQQQKPLIITEYGVLFPAWVDCPTFPDITGCPFSSQQVYNSFMAPSFDTFLNYTDANIGFAADGNRLVQRWNWFSVDFDWTYCDAGTSLNTLGGALFHSGNNVPCEGETTPLPPIGISELGLYWKQYVQQLPPGAYQPYSSP